MAFDPFMASLPSVPTSAKSRPVSSTAKAEPTTDAGGKNFASHLEQALDFVEAGNKEANVQAEKAALGEANLHDVALSFEKANINMRLMLKTRNKLVEAYQEIMRMPV